MKKQLRELFHAWMGWTEKTYQENAVKYLTFDDFIGWLDIEDDEFIKLMSKDND